MSVIQQILLAAAGPSTPAPVEGEHRYWSMKMLGPASTGEFAVGELRMATAPGGPNIALDSIAANVPVGTPSAYGTGYNFETAFDGVTDTYYQPGPAASVGAFFGIDFGSPVSIKEYRLINSAVANFMPKNWEFRYSDDGVTWTVCDTRTNQVFSNNVERSFLIS